MEEMKKLKDKILEEMEEIPKEWRSKLHRNHCVMKRVYWTRYGPGREFTEGYDWIMIYFSDKMSAKIFLNKHHESCF